MRKWDIFVRRGDKVTQFVLCPIGTVPRSDSLLIEVSRELVESEVDHCSVYFAENYPYATYSDFSTHFYKTFQPLAPPNLALAWAHLSMPSETPMTYGSHGCNASKEPLELWIACNRPFDLNLHWMSEDI